MFKQKSFTKTMKYKTVVYLFSVTIVVCFVSSASIPAFAGTTLTCGGSVLDAVDGTLADGAVWLVYDPDDSWFVAEGMVGDFVANYWAGEVGHYLNGLAVEDEVICFIEKEVAVGTTDHIGYYAVMNHILTNADPALFDEGGLQMIPIPFVEIVGEDAFVSWDDVVEYTEATNIIGFNVYRSRNGLNYIKLNQEPIADTFFTDVAFPGGTWYYAVSLVYRGFPPRDGNVVSGNSLPVSKSCVADLNGDSDVDGQDLAEFAQAYANNLLIADLSGDGFVTYDDVQAFASEYGIDCQ